METFRYIFPRLNVLKYWHIHRNSKQAIEFSVTDKVDVKSSLVLTKHHVIKMCGGVEVMLHTFLSSALDGGEWPVSHPGRFTHGERTPFAHCTGSWVGPRAGLDASVTRKICAPAGNRTAVTQPAVATGKPQHVFLVRTLYNQKFTDTV
jgi:hypothetical protein